MTQDIRSSELKLIAGGGLYDHLPPPMFPSPKPRRQTSEEKRAILDRLAGPQELMPQSDGYPPF